MVWRGGVDPNHVYISIYTICILYVHGLSTLKPAFLTHTEDGSWQRGDLGRGWMGVWMISSCVWGGSSPPPNVQNEGNPPLKCCIWWEVYTLIKPWQGGGIHPTDASSNSTVEMFVGFRCSWHIEELETNHWETGDKLPGLSQKHSCLSKIVGEPQMTIVWTPSSRKHGRQLLEWQG